MRKSICQEFGCPWWSPGMRSPHGGSVGNYGCTRYGVASHCLVNEIKNSTATEYEVWYDPDKQNGLQRDLIRTAIASFAPPHPWEEAKIEEAKVSHGIKTSHEIGGGYEF